MPTDAQVAGKKSLTLDSVEGQIVAAVGVSGAASAEQDDKIALAGAEAVCRAGSDPPKSPGPAGDVAYFDRQCVEAAFARGEPLYFGSAAVNCGVNPSRRDAPGEVEVHDHETDVMYITSGTATMVTGGSVTGARQVSPGQIRGDAIEGGQARALAAGDVIVIPRGVPHWFKDVQGTLLYFVVKVRS